MKKVLLADNDPQQLQAWSHVVRDLKYEVVTASSVGEAQDLLIKGDLDLAILDLHMESDADESDDSGLRLAQIYRESVPIIILTGKATVSAAVAALQRESRSSPAIPVVQKRHDGPRALGEAMERALARVFVSHGHDDNARMAVAKFLGEKGLQAVILSDQPLAGDTILNAFERCTNVEFAIILMTPDDEGRLKGDSNPLQPRARQNVIFELGYLVARLGRGHVVALCPKGVPLDWPSNYQGVLYIDLDHYGEWQNKLCLTMRAAGLQLL